MEIEPTGPQNEQLINKSQQSNPGYGGPTDQLIPMSSQAQPQQQSQSEGMTSFTIFVWKLFSVISWILLIITSLESYLRFSLFYSIHFPDNPFGNDVPIGMNITYLQSFFLILLFFAFYNFAYLGLYKGDNSIVDPFFQKITKYHFIPLLLVSLMNLNVHIIKDSIPDYKKIEGQIITNFIFTIISLAILMYIYLICEFNHEWYVVLTVKKGLFSCLIIILWYNFCYSIVLLGLLKSKTVKSFIDSSGPTFSVLIGIVSLLLSILFKDIIAAVTNLLIYIGMISHFFGLDRKYQSSLIISDKNTNGILQLIMMAFNIATIGVLIFKFNSRLTENINYFH